ncbi:MAG: riboflavin biosynthesis protein RibF [Betaproteobacteria bacterium RIFCSPHIGHO2_12_FULL_69_13]|nr:MAG: riboflavin biosynthesis protein RibF [Betaproteobacteria bacterium RIFCSPHIGHO2_12_FULL_69_13]OGA68184.1 MAG: riboflavin biosynthesis protein RibF [Betaproteobacteria bacterium RIFCSPLOWO2_12_FULL_68_20]
MLVTHGPLRTSRHVVTVGNFDGVHRGHRALLERLRTRGRESGLSSCVLTFEPHPREFFAPGAAPARLTRLRDKLELMAEAGIDRVHVARFDAPFAAMAADDFVERVLVRALGTRCLLVGRDFRFGARRAGDYGALERLAARHGFALEAMPDVAFEGERVASSAVRAALAAGDLARAERLLGRRYAISGRVAHGTKLGRRLGYPTANIVLRQRPPLAGIFVVEADDVEAGRTLRGVASVGRRPTVNETRMPLLEVHLFELDEDLYGRHLRVRFLAKLRDEEKFEGLEALRAAIARDAAAARGYFAATSDA